MNLIQQLIRHEGSRQHVYDDATGKPLGPGDTIIGNPTIAIGRNVSKDGPGLTYEERLTLLNNDIAKVTDKCRFTFDWFNRMNQARQDVVVNMIFNMGLTRFRGFKNTIKAFDREDYEDAANEMLDSAWSTQVGDRAVELSNQMREGKYGDPR